MFGFGYRNLLEDWSFEVCNENIFWKWKSRTRKTLKWVQGVQTNMLLIIQLLREAAEARLSRKEATLKKS